MNRLDPVAVGALMVLGAFLVAVAGHAAFPAEAQGRAVAYGLGGFLCGLAFAVSWRGDAALAAVAGYGAGVVMTAAVGVGVAQSIGFGRALVVILAGAGSLAALVSAVLRVTEGGETVGVESEWGGLGQGLGGWRLSAPAALLLAGVALAAVAAAAGMGAGR